MAPLVAPHQVAREMVAVVDAAVGHVARLHAHRAEARIPLAAGVFDRPGELDRRIERQAGLLEGGVGDRRILRAEHQPVQAERIVEQVEPARCCVFRNSDQLEIVGAEHGEMVHRAQRMVAALGEREAQAPVDVGGAVHVVARIDHHVIERGGWQCHCESPRTSAGSFPRAARQDFLIFWQPRPGGGNDFQ